MRGRDHDNFYLLYRRCEWTKIKREGIWGRKD